MLGALKPHLANGWQFTAAGGGWEYVAFLIVALGSLALAGGGAYSVDSLLRRPGSGTSGAAALVSHA
jgi:putative oxidoreductase